MPGIVACHQNEILVVSGCCLHQPKIVKDGVTFVWPALQTVDRLCTDPIVIKVDLKKQPTENTTVLVNLKAQVTLGIAVDHEELLREAISSFLSKSQDQIQKALQGTVEGVLGTVSGSMAPEQLKTKAEAFKRAVFESLCSECIIMGIGVKSISDIEVSDDHGFYKNLKTEEMKSKAEGNDQFELKYD
ncbi:hypothetical protein SNE40_000917 [Patella caerulea]|uniref:Band 7 domain-containing protein n=1 Tax=Patella caerulea TaxID=87958 RepID=A0AAN8KG10_PATCE